MTGFEEEIFEQSHFQLYLWLPYLDDIFCIWTEGLKNLKEFFERKSSSSSSILLQYLPWSIPKSKLIF